ncbi:putative adipose-regulatory protein-domain-containing protein [Bombardia bombarda]|uniref:Adipose-regulatory protein-domain-containing protein n=1 Tax=Bombardia bombarda TaxID=252184 RepID=A0AA40C7Y7_9PEZI|nr:putative adipose-regulatory protein-domain-containing protein [Bombardia bombarda]
MEVDRFRRRLSSSNKTGDPSAAPLRNNENNLQQLDDWAAAASPYVTETAETAWGYAIDMYYALTSKAAQKTVLNTALFVTTSTVLYALAAVGYLFFYHEYLPNQVTTVPVHLQYGYGRNPYGVASLAAANLKAQQPYDIYVSLTVPRSPANLERGNFMVAVRLLDGPLGLEMDGGGGNAGDNDGYGSPPPLVHPDLPAAALVSARNSKALYSATRPTLIPYTHPLVALASRVLFLAYHVVYPHASETTTLVVSMAERLAFGGGPQGGGEQGRLPTSILVEVQAGGQPTPLQVYEAHVTLAAKLGGLRWFMFRYRWTAFAALTGVFWAMEIGLLGLAWLALTAYFGVRFAEEDGVEGGDGQGERMVTVKKEGEMSDTERTFPSTSKQPPLKFEGRVGIKQEEGVGAGAGGEAGFFPVVGGPGADADDEDDEDEEEEGEATGYGSGWRDSGIGTSYSDHVSREGARKRSSGKRSAGGR